MLLMWLVTVRWRSWMMAGFLSWTPGRAFPSKTSAHLLRGATNGNHKLERMPTSGSTGEWCPRRDRGGHFVRGALAVWTHNHPCTVVPSA